MRTEQEINDLLNECMKAEENGTQRYPAMSYEQGVKAGIEWLLEYTNDHPLEEE